MHSRPLIRLRFRKLKFQIEFQFSSVLYYYISIDIFICEISIIHKFEKVVRKSEPVAEFSDHQYPIDFDYGFHQEKPSVIFINWFICMIFFGCINRFLFKNAPSSTEYMDEMIRGWRRVAMGYRYSNQWRTVCNIATDGHSLPTLIWQLLGRAYHFSPTENWATLAHINKSSHAPPEATTNAILLWH